MKKTALALITVGLLLGACTTETDDQGVPDVEFQEIADYIYEVHPTLRDGRTVTCLMTLKQGITCDWENAK
jgi:hypothetical protein